MPLSIGGKKLPTMSTSSGATQFDVGRAAASVPEADVTHYL
jgi:hypothetical protein